ncbi:hypothetical protein EVB32_085 [Rhizobium phage RHph_TM39]|nr:hypothetical protein EVB32_085 [Rhizobium phage RHph_TM39]QIG77412.1 hypothetical protein EVB61_084 [Rhizobium phage RHph_TM21B]QIG77672.1 hypothetical protein EVB64_085 [Rhizobium phage RHph_TM61]
MSDMMITVVEVEVNEDFIKHPATLSTSEVYFLKDGKIVGEGRIGGRYMGIVNVYPTNDQAFEFFKDDFILQTLDMLETDERKKWIHFKFHQYTGEYAGTFSDEPENRGEGLSVVDKFYFDFGIHSKRYEHIEGFGKTNTARSQNVTQESLQALADRFNN